MRFDWIVRRYAKGKYSDMRAFRTKESADQFAKQLNKRFGKRYSVYNALET